MKIKWLFTTLLAMALFAGAQTLYPARMLPGEAKLSSAASHLAAAAQGWSSGWVSINPGQTLTFNHNLGGDPGGYAVELWFRDTHGGLGIHRRNYGGLEFNDQWFGAHWQNLTANTIQVYRQPNDNAADQVRLRIWVPSTAPDYDSGWTNIAPAQTITFSHNLGVSAENLTTSLWFSGTARGIHHYSYGGLMEDAPPQLRGAFWHNLTDNTIRVSRQPHDSDIEQVRVTVAHTSPPSYDSGWQDIAPNSLLTITHNLNQDPNTLLVRGECYDPEPGGRGIHQQFAGGDHNSTGWQGLSLQNLTANAIIAARRANDLLCPLVRVRIWATRYNIYLPLVASHYPQTSVELSYDDGTSESEQSSPALNTGFAVRFTAPGASARLLGARYYLDAAQNNHPIQVHVWDANHNDLIAPFEATPPAGIGWFDVDLAAHNLTVSGDFYVGFLYSAQHSDPSLGVDTSSPDGRSYEVPWDQYGNDYMIRALVSPLN